MELASRSHCPRCGSAVAAEARFCPECGERQAARDSAPVAPDALLARVRAALLSDYEVVREVGGTDLTAVYLARDLRLPRRVALKVVRPEAARSGVMPQEFLAAARTASMLDHPSVVSVFHAGTQDGLSYVAMRYVDGAPLDRVLRAHGALPLAAACHVLAEAAAALAYAHGQGVVHRDVKPANVLLEGRTGRVLLTDFGLARAADGRRRGADPAAVDDAAGYFSPEQRAGGHPTGASDQYALGVMAFALLGGRLPAEGETALRALNADVPPILEALIARMLARQPEHRLRSLAEAASRFAEHAGARPELHETLSALVAATPVEPAHTDAPAEPAPTPAPVPVEQAAVGRAAVERAPIEQAAPDPTPEPVPVAAVAAVSTATTPVRDVLPFRPGLVLADAPASDDPPSAEPPTAEVPVPDESPAAEMDDGFRRTSEEALAHHRAWLDGDSMPPAPPPRRRAPLLVAGGVAVVGVIAAALLLTGDADSAPSSSGGETARQLDSAASVIPPLVAPSATAVDASPPAPAAGAAVDSAPAVATPDSAATRLTVRIAPPARTRLPVTLRVGDSLRLGARLLDGTNAVPGGTVVWRSSAPAALAVDSAGWIHARAVSPRAVAVTARVGETTGRLLVRVVAAAPVVAEAPPPAPAPAALAPPTPAEVDRVAAAVAARVEAKDAAGLRGLFDAFGGPHTAAPLLDVLREDDLKVNGIEPGAPVLDGTRATVPVQLRLKWRRGKFSRAFGVKVDEAAAALEARLDHADGRWQLAGLRLTSPFRR
jgi:serine/threonine-protein kinase